MKTVDLDVVLLLPETARRKAVECSRLLSGQLAAAGSSSCFELGKPFPGAGGEHCEPHVSLFMLTVDEVEVGDVTDVVEQLAKTLPVLAAEGAEYRHNPCGAPELYFAKSTAWREFQNAVVSSVEPLRRGRLREVDPAGSRIRDLVDSTLPDNPRRQQLLRYGYDEIADVSNGGHDRFNPHVTLAWPHDPDLRVPLDDLPAPYVFSGALSEIAVFGMSARGTCTCNYGIFPLKSGENGTTPRYP